jgi:hypothetical protein
MIYLFEKRDYIDNVTDTFKEEIAKIIKGEGEKGNKA